MFASDLALPGALWAAYVRSPHACGRVLSLDARPAIACVPGARVFRADAVPDIVFNSAGAPPAPELEFSADQRLLTDEPQHVGDAVAVVVATTRTEAECAARAVVVDWEASRPALDIDEAVRRGWTLGTVSFEEGGVEAALDAAAVTASIQTETPALQHVCLETHAAAAVPDGHGGVTIYSNTQTPSDVRRLCSDILSLPISRIRVVKLDEGGGFGCKQELYSEALLAWLALSLAQPVRTQYRRAEELAATRARHASRVEVTVGLDTDGTISAIDLNAIVDSGAYASHTAYVLGDLGSAAHYAYPRAAHRFKAVAVKTNTIPGGAYRGYGAPQANFAVEQAIDLAAARLGFDPIDVRRRSADPDAPGFAACLDAADDTLCKWRARPESDSRLRHGVGVATCAMLSTTVTGKPESTTALVRLNEDASVDVHTGSCDCGTGSHTVLAQIAADFLGVEPEQVAVHGGDTAAGVVDLGSFAQRTVYVGGTAVARAAEAARTELLELAGALHDRDPTDLRLHGGTIVDVQDAEFSIDLWTFCREQSVNGRVVTASVSCGPAASPRSHGVCCVAVAVDPETGELAIEDCLLAVDCGAVLNSLGATGQVVGGAVQGFAGALVEQWRPAAGSGAPPTLAEHGMLGCLDAPAVRPCLVNVPEPAGPFGAKGLGEVPIVPVAAAVANAVAAATGSRPMRLPLRPEEIHRIMARP